MSIEKLDNVFRTLFFGGGGGLGKERGCVQDWKGSGQGAAIEDLVYLLATRGDVVLEDHLDGMEEELLFSVRGLVVALGAIPCVGHVVALFLGLDGLQCVPEEMGGIAVHRGLVEGRSGEERIQGGHLLEQMMPFFRGRSERLVVRRKQR
jgi:hypothetical protein